MAIEWRWLVDFTSPLLRPTAFQATLLAINSNPQRKTEDRKRKQKGEIMQPSPVVVAVEPRGRIVSEATEKETE